LGDSTGLNIPTLVCTGRSVLSCLVRSSWLTLLRPTAELESSRHNGSYAWEHVPTRRVRNPDLEHTAASSQTSLLTACQRNTCRWTHRTRTLRNCQGNVAQVEEPDRRDRGQPLHRKPSTKQQHTPASELRERWPLLHGMHDVNAGWCMVLLQPGSCNATTPPTTSSPWHYLQGDVGAHNTVGACNQHADVGGWDVQGRH
jgi:hypothetical protein